MTHPVPTQEIALDVVVDEIRALLRRSAQDIAAIGAKLTQIQKTHFHKNVAAFHQWANEELGLSHGTVANFQHAAALLPKYPTIGDFELGVIYELAAPKTPEKLIEAVIEGEVEPDVKVIREAKRELRGIVEREEEEYGSGSSSSSGMTVKELTKQIITLVQGCSFHDEKYSQALASELAEEIKPVVDRERNFPFPHRREKTRHSLQLLGRALIEASSVLNAS